MIAGSKEAEIRSRIILGSKKIVVKIGSRILTGPRLGLRKEFFRDFTADVSRLLNTGRQVIIVSSGAIAAGMGRLGLKEVPKSIPENQAAAAVGQGRLIHKYEKNFARHGITVGQMLLTQDDFSHRRRFLNARHTLLTLLDFGTVAIINENDSVVVEEIKFGDNDNLSAMVTTLIGADLLVFLTNTDGLYDGDPASGNARLVSVVERIDAGIESMAGESNDSLTRGGMESKLAAAKKASLFGVPTIIANGNIPGILFRLFTGEPLGTLFLPQEDKLKSRKQWIAYTLKPMGSFTLDDGAFAAIKKKGKSLLPSGILKVTGNFDKGDCISLKNSSGKEFARGLSNYSSKEVNLIKGLQTAQIEGKLGYKVYDEVIHRDDLVLMEVDKS
jgi:glutamate 5-kinase